MPRTSCTEKPWSSRDLNADREGWFTVLCGRASPLPDAVADPRVTRATFGPPPNNPLPGSPSTRAPDRAPFALPMDVTCERCSTAYEFDDALVSERGTTVKCTNCGHQFKVKRAQNAGAPELWQVRTIDGRELEFKALRELQTAIAQTQISREDVLLRGGSRPRRLGSIAELEPFFIGAGPHPSHGTTMGLGDPQRRQRIPTPQGLGVIVGLPGPQRTEGSVAIPLPSGPREINGLDDETSVMPPGPPHRRSTPSIPPPPPPRRSAPSLPPPGMTLPGVVVSPAGAPQIPDGEGSRPRSSEALRTLPVPLDDALPPPTRTPHVSLTSASSHDPAAPFRGSNRPPAPDYTDADLDDGRGLPPLPEPPLSAPSLSSQQRVSLPPPSATPTPGMHRGPYSNEENYSEPRFSTLPSEPRRAGAARWIVGFIVAGMLALGFATVGRKLLVTGTTTGIPAVDQRIGTLLQEGEKSLLDGDLESAQEQFAKASGIEERDARVATNLAHLAAVRGDIAWLRVRLLPDGDPDLDTAKRELDQAAERSRKATAAAAELAPNDPAVVRARIDTLRLSGDMVGARRLVSSISAASAQADNALALAALDLGEAKPDWTTVIGRLRVALSVDQNLGRARAMLVYALARSGDVTTAKAELERMIALPRPHALVRPLRAFVSRESGAVPEASGSVAAGKQPPGTATAPSAGPRERPVEPPVTNPRPPRDEPTTPTPPAGGTIDTSDLPGIKAPPTPTATSDTPTPTTAPTPTAAPAPTPTSTVPAGVDTSDLPGFK